jgi:nifR3 family TIM-barrel protein
MAPLAGITNLPFRRLVKEAGCALVCSEMISANGLVHASQKTRQMLDSAPGEGPLSVQIFGTDPSVMAEAARIVEASGAAMIDINFGCSVRKVLKTGSGSALMRDPAQAAGVITAVRGAVSIPVTIKIRSGWDRSGDQAVATARLAEACGADAVAVHPRTATQGFSGRADWSVIARVKQSVRVPVIGNGDIQQPRDAPRMMASTGCDAIMIGRSAVGNPWIFTQLAGAFRGEIVSPVSLDLRETGMLRFLRDSVQYFGETHACRMMRSRLGWFAKGLPHSGHFREAIKHLSTEREGIAHIRTYMQTLREEPGSAAAPGSQEDPDPAPTETGTC